MNILRFLLLTCLMSIAISCGQQKRFVTYKVKQGEKMKDIANRLDLRTRDLLRLNPDVGRYPKAGTMIVIPEKKMKKRGLEMTDGTKEPDTIPENAVKVERVSNSYITHTVKPKETIYYLTRKYEISKETLIEWNPEYPELKNNKLNIGQVLKVGKYKETSYEYIPKEDVEKEYITHTVQPKETLFSITHLYNITKEDLIEMNPQYPDLKNDVVKFGQVLKIRSVEEGENVEGVYQDEIDFGNTINIAMLFPFDADKYKSESADNIFSKNKVSNLITDYYLGAEMAIDSIKNMGINVNAKVYDTGRKGNNTSEIIASKKLDDVDAVIGPFFINQAKLVANKVGVPVIYPHFSKKQNSFSDSDFVKTAPEIDEYVTKLTSYLKKKYTNETIFVIGDGRYNSNTQVNKIVSNLQQHDAITSKKINVLKPEDGYIEKKRFTDKIQSNTHCWVIITSEDRATVADVLNSFLVLPEKVTAQVFAVNKGVAYDKVDNNKLADLGFTYVSDNFINENDEITKIFNKKYKAKNNALPTPYAIKGFDVTYDVLIRLASGNKLKKTFKEGTSVRIANKFDYKTKLFGSTSNKGLFIVKYNKDLSLSRLE